MSALTTARIGAHYREDAARGLTDHEDLWHAGTLTAQLAPDDTITVSAWADVPSALPAEEAVAAGRARARTLVAAASDAADAQLMLAADQSSSPARPSSPGTPGSATGHATR